MRQRQPLQGNNSQTGWQRLGENSQSCVGVAGGGGVGGRGGRANDIAHFHVAGHGMKSGRKGGGSGRNNTQLSDGEPSWREIDKIHQHTHCVYVIFRHCPLTPHLSPYLSHCRPTSHSIHARSSKRKSICDMANIRNYIQIVAGKLSKGE